MVGPGFFQGDNSTPLSKSPPSPIISTPPVDPFTSYISPFHIFSQKLKAVGVPLWLTTNRVKKGVRKSPISCHGNRQVLCQWILLPYQRRAESWLVPSASARGDEPPVFSLSESLVQTSAKLKTTTNLSAVAAASNNIIINCKTQQAIISSTVKHNKQ